MAINEKLEKIYEKNHKEFAAIWASSFQEREPKQWNVFGVVDEEKYANILFIGKETNGWGHEELEKKDLFLPWLRDVSDGKLRGEIVSKHPQVWYNVGRWTKRIVQDGTTEELLLQKGEALEGIKYIAFTNINKLWGHNASGKAYRQVKESAIAADMLQQEIKELNPKVIVLCGIEKEYVAHMVVENVKVIEMPHPSARKSKRDMLDLLEKQLDE